MNTPPPNPDCSWARDAASASTDDELAGDDEVRLADHLAGCAACTEFSRRVAVLARTSRIRVARSDPAFVARVMATALRFRDELRSTK